MSKNTCERIVDAEALVDRRLDGGAQSALLAHAETCDACARELMALRQVDATMRALPALETTPAETRRAHARLTRVLERAGEARVSHRHAHLMFAAATVAILAFFVERNFFRDAVTTRVQTVVTPAVVASAPTFDVANVDSAVWQSKVDGNVARSALSDGVAGFHVQTLHAGQRFLLALPDGEIEVHGTRFVVSVRHGATESVEVSEGLVALRLKDSPERLLHAGERWPEIAPPSAPSSASSSAAPASAVAAHDPVAAPVPRPIRTATPPVGSTAATGPVPAVGENAAERFVAATGAFQSGSYARADTLLAGFLHDFPNDPRCEDAAFLRAMAHTRTGDREGAAKLAAAYLQSFPRGLRRPEAEQLVRER